MLNPNSRSQPRRSSPRALLAVAAALATTLLMPTSASALSNVGGSVASGSAHFTQPIPPAGQPCAATSFSLTGGSNAFTLTTIDPNVISGYFGPLTFSGSGGSTCESASSGSGSLTLSATGDGSVRCPSLTGSYTRAATDVQVTLGGACTINNVPAQVVFAFHGEFAPTNSGGGITAPITDATFAGAVIVLPA